ncbi:hypothetical protein DAEQUDRAFT_289946 [Daedalea quercina L-15889]|uniref:Uncharacterized protein n=1 Tax=Daedalea quercina L-15889 TaxID=1314783 RepID=A0A165TXV2_9APHY|nr:hypothetical protein DAEQUDRAFT_289946 [Daedalea quercina L-15889]
MCFTFGAQGMYGGWSRFILTIIRSDILDVTTDAQRSGYRRERALTLVPRFSVGARARFTLLRFAWSWLAFPYEGPERTGGLTLRLTKRAKTSVSCLSSKAINPLPIKYIRKSECWDGRLTQGDASPALVSRRSRPRHRPWVERAQLACRTAARKSINKIKSISTHLYVRGLLAAGPAGRIL